MLSATLRALEATNVLEPALSREGTLADLRPDLTESGFGYLRVGLRCLASQGWLERAPGLEPATTSLRFTKAGRAALEHREHYIAAGELLASFARPDEATWSHPWPGERAVALHDLVARASARWTLDGRLPAGEREIILAHLDGSLAVPTVLSLLRANALGDSAPLLPEGTEGRAMGALLELMDWTDGSGTWTDAGARVCDVAPVFGLVGSYLPLLSRLAELYEGRLTVPTGQDGHREWHVDRELNIAASAAAHSRYFADADAVFSEIFDREPLEAQPRFIADTGCGDGSWLVHLYGLVTAFTLRGRNLVEHPLRMVGLDCSDAALERARDRLAEARVPALLLRGDVSDPDGIAEALAAHGLTIDQGLHVRSFLDHDRTYRGEGGGASVPGWSSGAYVDGRGRPLNGAAVERDLVAHLLRWTPHVRRHGLVVLEAHCVAPDIARRHVGALHSVTFDAYHGLSHQYPIEHSAFVRCCRESGLQPATHRERRYPSSRPFVAVSVNRLRPDCDDALPGLDPGGPRHDTWQPAPGTDLADGLALHELLYQRGDLRHPRLWCSAPTGRVVEGALQAIGERLGAAGEGDVIRVLDYGAGTGLAAIELLKACGDQGLERDLARRGASLELHLVDLPSSWFAQGHALLGNCAWTRFHSLRGPGGGFRELDEALGGLTFDAVMANMVFHLVPAHALPRAVAGLARVTRPGGRLEWSSPDLGPRGQWSLLFHDPNRQLRRRWLERVGRSRDDPGGNQRRADQRILPEPNLHEDVAAALAASFEGSIERPTHELLVQDSVDTLLVPANQAEYLPEVTDPERRELLIRELMLDEVLPALRAGPAGTASGLNVQWTLGSYARRRD
ncbi:MAG: class I SAM-dependent methyltransferase [Actinomycetota bacterium]|nr:class I SAM-dependent methyltransferase [Actinomycetota bacterium]